MATRDWGTKRQLDLFFNRGEGGFLKSPLFCIVLGCMNIFDFEEKVLAFDLDKAVEFAVNNTSEKLEDVQVAQQFAGLDGNGDRIGDYKPFTIRAKKSKGQPFDRGVTLRDTGAFHAGVTIFADNGVLTFTSTDAKTALIEAQYGERIWGIAPVNQARVKGDLKPFLRTYWEGL